MPASTPGEHAVEGAREAPGAGRLVAALFAAIVVLAGALRFHALDHKPLHYDEGNHWYFFIDAIYRGETLVHRPGFHGFASWYLSALPMHVVGVSVAGLRFMVALAGVGLVALLALLRRPLGGAVLAAGLLVALSPALVYYTRHVSQYPYFLFFMLLTVVLAVRFATTGRTVWLHAAAASLGALVTTHALALLFGAMMLVALLAAYAALCRSGAAPSAPPAVRAALRPRAILTAILVFTVVVVTVMTAFFSSVSSFAGFVLELVAQLEKSVSTGQNKPFWYYARALAPLEPAAFLGLLAAPLVVPSRRFFSIFVAMWAWLSALALSAIPYKVPWMFTVALVPMYLLFGLVVRETWERAAQWSARRGRGWPSRAARCAPIAAVIALAGLAGVTTVDRNYLRPIASGNVLNYVGPTPSFQALVDRLRSLARPSTVLLAGDDYWPLPFYLRGHELVFAPPGGRVDPRDCPGCAVFIAEPGQIAGAAGLVRERYEVRDNVFVEVVLRR